MPKTLLYQEKEYTIPSLEILGPYTDRDGIPYTNIILSGSDCFDFSTDKKSHGTFRDRELIALRDYLNEKFPVQKDENECLTITEEELEDIEAELIEDEYVVDYNEEQKVWVVSVVNSEQLALFKYEDDAEDYAESLRGVI